MSSSVLSDHGLLAFIVQQYQPDCVMVSSCPPGTNQQAELGLNSQGTVFKASIHKVLRAVSFYVISTLSVL